MDNPSVINVLTENKQKGQQMLPLIDLKENDEANMQPLF